MLVGAHPALVHSGVPHRLPPEPPAGMQPHPLAPPHPGGMPSYAGMPGMLPPSVDSPGAPPPLPQPAPPQPVQPGAPAVPPPDWPEPPETRQYMQPARSAHQPAPADAVEQGPRAPPQPKALPAGLRPQMKPTAVRIQRPAQVQPRSVAVAAARGPAPADLTRPLEGKSRITRPVPPQPAAPANTAGTGETAGGADGSGDAYSDFMASLKSLGAY